MPPPLPPPTVVTCTCTTMTTTTWPWPVVACAATPSRTSSESSRGAATRSKPPATRSTPSVRYLTLTAPRSTRVSNSSRRQQRSPKSACDARWRRAFRSAGPLVLKTSTCSSFRHLLSPTRGSPEAAASPLARTFACARALPSPLSATEHPHTLRILDSAYVRTYPVAELSIRHASMRHDIRLCPALAPVRGDWRTQVRHSTTTREFAGRLSAVTSCAACLPPSAATPVRMPSGRACAGSNTEHCFPASRPFQNPSSNGL
ncbi:hypothetical protein JKP88DRAFT_216244 [Tribonema minus]|uniref:Uncharacterized protein n=1 Tax=Tribonema minus TaxID=303371 RepID=A0A835YTU9_9STRA|nr:hypothetical protein JKP88DRAFT_216244 [Tribonema minus]